MNKKTNTVLFILGATVFNVLVCLAGFIGLFFLYITVIAPVFGLGEESWSVAIIFIFAGGIALSILVYRVVLKAVMKKIDVDKYFDPIFTRSRSIKKN